MSIVDLISNVCSAWLSYTYLTDLKLYLFGATYAVCLATVDRRSHERFIESNNQIGLLVDKFKLEGNSFRKAGGGFSPIEGRGSSTPLHALGRPSAINAIGTLIMYD